MDTLGNALPAASSQGMPMKLTQLSDILRLQDAMIAAMGNQGTDDYCPVQHFFAPGMYARAMFIPAGGVLVGKMHRFEHLAAILTGRIRVASEFGDKEMFGPCLFVSPAGVKRAGFALQDTVWVTFHATEKTDLEEIERELIVPETEVLAMARQEALT